MIDSLLKNKNWTSKTIGEFIKEMQNYSNDEKCLLITRTSKELLKRGGNANISSAENLLIYATQHYFDVSNTQLKANIYYALGELYEKYKENFIRAYTYYEKYTLNNKENAETHALMLKILLLRDNFTYSDELEKEFRMSLGESDLGLRNDRIYENLGRYIILEHEGKEDECKAVIKRLWGIVKTDELIIPDLIIKRNLNDRVNVPEKIKTFIYEKNKEINQSTE